MGMEDEIKRVIELMSLWVTKIEGNNYLDFFDINKVAEDLALKLLNEIYKLELINLNDEKPNYPGIDLGDKINKIAYQVTSRSDARKIQENLETFVKEDKAIYSNGIRFLILNEVKPKLSGKKWQGIDADFNPKEHIITHLDLITEIKRLYDADRPRFERIKAILEEEIAVKGLKDGKGKKEAKGKQIKILSITASPDDAADIFYEQEQDTMLNAFQFFDRDDVYLDMPDPVKSTLDEIKERLEDGKHDILHITAHGNINDKGEGVLCFENHRGKLETVTGSQLAEVLKGLTPAPLILILSACLRLVRNPI